MNNGTDIDAALNPLTFILSPGFGGEGRVRGALSIDLMFHYFCETR
jgi:hypothetical protein